MGLPSERHHLKPARLAPKGLNGMGGHAPAAHRSGAPKMPLFEVSRPKLAAAVQAV